MNIKKAKRGSPFKHEATFRRKICEELQAGHITLGEVAKKYNVPRCNIYRWIAWYENEQKELLSSGKMNSELPKISRELEKPDTNLLEEELRLAQVKITTLEAMIDIAEEQFKIEIRKKSGTKPSLE